MLLSPVAHAAAPLSADDVQTLDGALRDRSTPMKVRLEAALICGREGGPELVPALLDALGDPEFPVRAAAALSLGQMGDARAAGGLVGRLDDPERFVREEATEGLQSLIRRGYGRAVEEQARHQEPATRVKLLAVAAGLGQGLGGGLVAQALADPDPAVHAAAQSALDAWRPGDAVRFLLGALGSTSPAVRAAAARELGRRRASAAIPALSKMLVSPGETAESLDAARAAIRDLAQNIDLGQQLQLAQHGAPPERTQAMAVLAAMQSSDAYVVLEHALDDPDLAIRADAALDLAVLGDRRAANRIAVLAERPENAPIQKVLQGALQRLQAAP